MNFRAFDLFAFIRAGEPASGTVNLADMSRLLAEQAADAPADVNTQFRWKMQGAVREEATAGQAARQRLFIDLEVDGAVDRKSVV